MIIIDKATDLTFGDLECGDVFKKKYMEKDCFMKTEVCVTTEDNCRCNFVTLVDGCFGGFMHDDEEVIKVNCQLVVE